MLEKLKLLKSLLKDKNIICPICNTNIHKEGNIDIYISKYNKEKYKLYRCPNCDAEFWEPLKIIPDFYDKEGEEAYGLFHSGIRTMPYWQKSFFKYFPLKSGRILDIGCGDGIFLKEAQKKGFDVWGLDFDKKSIKISQEKFGLKNTYAMSLVNFTEFAIRQKIKFDVITFFEVLEHQDKPEEFINSVKSLLNNNGYIAGSVPNRESIIVKIERKLYQGDFPPHHFLRFSKKVILKFFLRNGFYDIETFLIHYPLIEYSAFIESVLTRNVGLKIKTAFKAIIRKHKNDMFVNDYSIKKKIVFNMLKTTRSIVFLPFAIISKPFLFLRFIEGNDIYFQAKLK